MAQAQRKESRIERPCGYAYPLWDRGRATGLERTSTQRFLILSSLVGPLGFEPRTGVQDA